MRLLTSLLAVKVMLALRQAGKASLADLSRALDATPSSVQRALEILVDDGLVRTLGGGRSRRYEIDPGSALADSVERLGDALLEPLERARLMGRSNPTVELVGHAADQLVVVFGRGTDVMVQSRAARAASLIAAQLELVVCLIDHDDARRPGPNNAALRAALLTGRVLVGDLDASVPDRSQHRGSPGIPLGHINSDVRLPSRRTLRALKRRHHVRRMRAFGSAVRSDFRPDSDVDLAVQLSPDADRSSQALEALEHDLARRLGRETHVVFEEDLLPAFRWAIRDEAVAI
jgi:predicted nucleotidyltransferase/DNA-binding transcriptional ArsR family regulator